MRLISRGSTGAADGPSESVRVRGVPDCEGESSGEYRFLAYKKAIQTVQSLFIAYCGGVERISTNEDLYGKKANVYTTKFPNGN